MKSTLPLTLARGLALCVSLGVVSCLVYRAQTKAGPGQAPPAGEDPLLPAAVESAPAGGEPTFLYSSKSIMLDPEAMQGATPTYLFGTKSFDPTAADLSDLEAALEAAVGGEASGNGTRE